MRNRNGRVERVAASAIPGGRTRRPARGCWPRIQGTCPVRPRSAGCPLPRGRSVPGSRSPPRTGRRWRCRMWPVSAAMRSSRSTICGGLPTPGDAHGDAREGGCQRFLQRLAGAGDEHRAEPADLLRQWTALAEQAGRAARRPGLRQERPLPVARTRCSPAEQLRGEQGEGRFAGAVGAGQRPRPRRAIIRRASRPGGE